MSKAYLLTGQPQIGKTTAIKKVVEALGRDRCGGFYTEEIRVQGTRSGFRLVTLDGQEGMLAHVDSKSPVRVGRFGVNLKCLEALGIPALYEAMTTRDYIVLDELGPMEVSSGRFKAAVVELLSSPCVVIGTIVLRSHPWLDALKQREEVIVYRLTRDNQEHTVETVIQRARDDMPT